MSSSRSIYQTALGREFGLLQPELQAYFSLHETSGVYGIGRGTFDVAGCPLPAARPVFALAARENAFFPEYGSNVPFTIRNYAHADPFGRPSLTARREIRFQDAARVFEDTTSLGPRGLVDYLGRHRRMATDLTCSVSDAGRMRMVSTRTRLLAGALRLAVPDAVGAQAYMEQWWDPATHMFRIQTRVIHRQLGDLLVYAGSFSYEAVPYDGGLPAEARPLRWEQRR